MILMVLIQLLCAVMIFVSAWMMICNYWAHADVTKFLTAVRNRPLTGLALLQAFDKVTYGQHVRARFLGRDPWKLYDPAVLDAIKNPVMEVRLTDGHDVVIRSGPPGDPVEVTKH